ncbi:hypothetical protein CRG98_015074 [Punica granatum]|uniref:Uncharacterized protein n=1 Tax=Punica granatum TaxID=22663 RepID=A0A2I0K7I5_PUNGR|nr:hypothetical protein CRG98_015074 [Punica granatum]
MYERKSRGSGRGSRKTRIEGYGWVTRMSAAVAVRGKMGRHASFGHGTEPDYVFGWNGMLGTSNRKSKPGNGLRGWKICRLGNLVIFGLSQVGWPPEYRVVFRRFWPVSALARAERSGLCSSSTAHDLVPAYFASDCWAMNSVPGFDRESLCGKPVGQNGVLTPRDLELRSTHPF